VTADLKKELSALPESVLVGTDVVPLADVLSTASRIPTTGTFRSEQGGAEAQVRLAAGTRGPSLRREFSEPGTNAQIKLYENLQAASSGVRLSGKDIEVLGMGKSLLVLEKHSGVDGIPGSMWIQYEPTK
jgi:hypothetical protein